MTAFTKMAWRPILMALCTMSLPASPVSAAGPRDVLKLVPDDAWGFVALRSLGTVDQRAARINEILGLGLPAPVTPMVLGMLNIMEDVDMARPVCVVMLDVHKFGVDDPGQAAVVLVPAKSPKAMIQKLGGTEPQDDIYKCLIMGDEISAAVKDGFVILGKNQDCVTKVLKTSKSLAKGYAKARSDALGESDVFVSVSLDSVYAAYKEQIQMFAPMLTAAGGMQPEAVQELLKTIDDLAGLDLSINLGKETFALQVLITPKSGTMLETTLKETKIAEGPLVSLLPKEKYLFAAATAGGLGEHSALKLAANGILSQAFQRFQIQGMNESATKTLDDQFLTIFKKAGRFAMSACALPEAKNGMFGLTFVAEADSPMALVEAFRTIYKNVWTLSDDEDLGSMKEKIVLSEAAETIAGNKFDTIRVDLRGFSEQFDVDEKTMKDAETILGKDCVLRFGAAGKTHFVCTFGGTKDRLARVCKTVASGSSDSLSGDKGINRLARNLPSPRGVEGYVAVDNLMHFVKSLTIITGGDDEMPFDVPKMDTPLGMSQTQIGSVHRTDIVIPTDMIKAVKKAIDEQTMAAMNDFDEEGEDEDENEDAEDGDL